MITQAHDRLHRDDVEAAHGFIHAALGEDDAPRDGIQPLGSAAPFDQAFIELCRRTGVVASYVMVMGSDDEGCLRVT